MLNPTVFKFITLHESWDTSAFTGTCLQLGRGPIHYAAVRHNLRGQNVIIWYMSRSSYGRGALLQRRKRRRDSL